jgi:hypothetical protein
VDYSRITLEAGMVMKKASGDDSPLRQGGVKSFWTLLNSGQRRRWLTVLFMDGGYLLRVFSMKLIYRRKGDVRGWLRGPHQGLAP